MADCIEKKMSEDKKDKPKKNKPVNVKSHIASLEEYKILLENTPEENQDDFRKALDYYSSQWQVLIDVLTEASNDKEVSKAFMEELQKRYSTKITNK